MFKSLHVSTLDLVRNLIRILWGTWGVSETALQGVKTLPLNMQSQVQLALADSTWQKPQAQGYGEANDSMLADEDEGMPDTFVSNGLVPPLACRGTS